ncbi:MAG TPA: TylF/MycF/NovP-related O-methyltransferase [Nitrospiraceae bacterium]|nr:TylF/MycF/NovP-related O-methyltransferase [Nitrospiraceae bacterium]
MPRIRNILHRLTGTHRALDPTVAISLESTEGAVLPERTKILKKVKPFTMVPEPAIDFLVEQVLRLIRENVPGVLMECGVWRGGCSMAMLLAQQAALGRVERLVYMLDSFQGLPPVTARDGPLARQWQDGGDPDNFLDNCKAVRSDVERALADMRFADGDFKIVEGWFDQTVSQVAREVEPHSIALLRLDGDWYDSTRCCLDALMPLVSEGGVVVIDDYYAWDGCARAVHDYLSGTDAAYRIRSLPNWYGAYFVKKVSRNRFDEL